MKELKTWQGVSLTQITSLVTQLEKIIVSPALIILEGDLGSGKTTLVQNFLHHLSSAELPLSPTYSLLQEVNDTLHGDFYRLKTPEELVYLEIPLLLEGKKYFWVEWGKELLPFLSQNLPPFWHTYQLTIKGDENARSYFLYKL